MAGWGSRKSFGVGDAGRDQAVADAAIFFGREDVVADGEVVRVAVDELEGEHAALGIQPVTAEGLHIIRLQCAARVA